jgi:hypothetical protein
LRHHALLTTALVALTAASASAQHLYSQALTYPGGRMAINLKLVAAQANTTFAVSVTAHPLLNVTAPTSVTSDARGYASCTADVQRTIANSAPLTLRITLAHPSLPNGSLVKNYLVKSRNGEIGSAWPEFLQVQGAFCNPANAASAQLQVDRASDLDGDGVYGDLNFEREASGKDPLDFPSEYAADNNAQGTLGCLGGSPPGVFQPGHSSGRQVAFLADNRVVTAVCTFTTQMNFLEDICYAPAFHGRPAVLAVTSGADRILICRDADGDGSIGATEIKIFFDPLVLVNNENYSPDGVAWDPTRNGRVYWISDKAGATGSPVNQGILQLDDSNADDAIGAGEWKASWTGTTAPVLVENQTIDHTEFECLHVDGAGGVLVNQTALGTIFRWLDANNNGVAETGEVRNWLTYNTTSALTKSADFLTPTFPVLPGTFYAMNLIESVAGVGSNNREVYFIGWVQATGIGAGFVFRCEDKNQDGDVNDLNEVTIFNDPAAVNDPLLFPPNFVSGLDVAGIDENADGRVDDSELFVYGAFPNGPKPSCGFTQFNDLNNWRFRDRNGDGDALDAGEHERISIHPTGAFNRGLELAPAAIDGGFRPSFYQRSAVMTLRHPGCRSPAGETVELDLRREKLEEGTQGTPFGGNPRFGFVTRGNGPSTTANAGLVLSATLLPAPFPIGSCSLWLQPPLFADMIPPAIPDATGAATFDVPIPAVVRGTLFVQAVSLQSGQLVLGETAEVRID